MRTHNTEGRPASGALRRVSGSGTGPAAADAAPDHAALDDRSGLLRSLGVDIDPTLLTVALTHRSFSYEHGGENYERLEFLGDSVLGYAVTTKLFDEHPDFDQSQLSKRRAALVSGAALASVARGLGIGPYIRLGRGEERTGGAGKESILADVMEALIGAAFLSAGPQEADALVRRLIVPLETDPARSGAAADPKTALQELADELHAGAPVYETTSTGPDHSKRFHAIVTVGGVLRGEGEGTSKKQAEVAAALEAWMSASGTEAGSEADPGVAATGPGAAEQD